MRYAVTGDASGSWAVYSSRNAGTRGRYPWRLVVDGLPWRQAADIAFLLAELDREAWEGRHRG